MKTLKGRFIKSDILLILISAALVLFVTMLLLFFISSTEPDGFKSVIDTIRELFTGSHDIRARLNKYGIIWAVAVSFGIVTACVLLTSRLLRCVMEPVTYLKKAADRIETGDLDFEVFSCDTKEMNDLCLSFDSIRKKLKANADKEDNVNAERNMLVANISHDMRTPITTIKGYLEGIRDGVADSPEKREKYLDTIYAKTLVLEKLVDNITMYSELEMGRMQYVFEYMELTPYLMDLAEEYESDIVSNDMELVCLFTDSPLLIVGDRIKLKRVFDNLISNAIKYSNAGAKVTISTETYDRGVIVSVSDTGKGIPKADIENVFKGFYRGDAARTNVKGNGLGLAIAREIVESHHGKIWVKSEEGTGTEFYIYLPLRERVSV